MSSVQENTDTQNKEPFHTDLESLLEAANLSEFTPSNGLTEEKKEFEKLESFFEIIQSSEVDDVSIASEEENSQLGELSEKPDDDIDNLDFSDEQKNIVDDDFNGENADDLEDNTFPLIDEKNDENGNVEDLSNFLQIGSSLEEDTGPVNDLPSEESELTEGAEISTDVDTASYQQGYQAALEEFERSMLLEKKSVQDLVETIFSINDDLQAQLEDLIKKNIYQLSSEFIGLQLPDFHPSFIKKIKTAAEGILTKSKDVILELNHADLEVLKNSVELDSLGLNIVEESSLRRGEFNLKSDSTGFQQAFKD